jgi:hypothetical protein
VRYALLGALAAFVAIHPAKGQDLSPETLAVLHDVLAPYQGAGQQGTGEEAAALNAALAALRTERLLGWPRPPVEPIGVAPRLGQALALGNRTREFLPDIAVIWDALVRQDQPGAEQAIQALYEKIGRKRPEGPALVELMNSVQKFMAASRRVTERTEIKKPDYTIVIENARGAGRAKVDVVMTRGPDGRPARTTFAGHTTTRADPTGTDLVTQVVPAAQPDIMTATQAEALKRKLNGKWRDQRGAEYEIAVDGDSVVVTHHNRAVVPPKAQAYRGQYRLGTINARYEVTSANDMGVQLPETVRKQIAGWSFGFEIKLEAKEAGGKLEGTWASQYVTHSGAPNYKVDRVHGYYDVALMLTRPHEGYRIVSLDIDYRPWEARQQQLRARIQIAEDDVKRLTSLLTDALGVLDDRQDKAQQALRAYADARRDWETADAKSGNVGLPEEAKSDAYRALERRRDRLAREVERLYNALTERDSRNPPPPVAFQIHDERSSELDAINRELEKIANDAGLQRTRERARAESHAAFVAYIANEGKFLAAAAVLENARESVDDLETELLRAKGKAAAAIQELARFSASMRRVGGTLVDQSGATKHETTIWEPKELLDHLNSEIATLGRLLEAAAAKRRETRSAFLTTREESIVLSDRLRSGIMASAAAQGLTEFGFSAWDVVEKFKELGPAGAIGETAKKVLEAVILDPPSFYEPTLSLAFMTAEGNAFPDIWPELENVKKYLKKRAVKTYGTSPAASIVVKKYIETTSFAVYRQLIDEAIVGSDLTGYRVAGPTQAARAMQAFASFESAQAGYQKAMRESLFRNLARSSRASLVETVKEAVKASVRRPRDELRKPTGPGKLQEAVYKEMAKMAAKTFFAEWLEGAPLVEFMASDAQARLATQIFMAASGVYWQVRDDYEARVAEQREVLRQYDPKNHMRIITSETFGEKAALRIILRDGDARWLPASDREVTVKVGGKPATQVPGDTLTYSLDPAGLAHDGKGGVALEVIVAR